MNDAYNAVITGYNWLLILLITCTEVTNCSFRGYASY